LELSWVRFHTSKTQKVALLLNIYCIMTNNSPTRLFEGIFSDDLYSAENSRTARIIGLRVLSKVAVAAVVAEEQAKIDARNEITFDKVIKGFVQIARSKVMPAILTCQTLRAIRWPRSRNIRQTPSRPRKRLDNARQDALAR
jgi:hypothetical protein